MSVKLMSMVWEYAGGDMDASEAIVLLSYADYANDDGSNAYPSYRTVAERTKLSRRTVMRVVERLIEKGFLERIEGEFSKRFTVVFQVCLDRLTRWRSVTSDTASPVTERHPPSDTVSPEPVTERHPPSDTVSPNPPLNHHLTTNDPDSGDPPDEIEDEVDDEVEREFATFRQVYPKRAGSNPWHPAKLKFARLSPQERKAAINAARDYAKQCDELRNTGTQYVKQAVTWFNQRCWEDDESADEPEVVDPEVLARANRLLGRKDVE